MHYVVIVLSKFQVLNATIIIVAGEQVCYDWSRGAENHNPANAKTSIYLHSPQEAEVKGKPRIATGRK
uniref:Uncharacterized protein n=1 Tax=Aegilops tauschii subsp. strangulata TaxID=200361 RepID=A0A452XMU7_AEGTS